MARRGLTVLAVTNLKARDQRYEVPDPGCPGLFLQIHPTGKKSWAYRYRISGKSKKLTIGTAYNVDGTEVIKIGDARDVADAARVQVARRVDPIAVEKEKRREVEAEARAAENTLQAKADEWLQANEHLRSAKNMRSFFARLIYPRFGDRQVETIKRSEIAALMKDVAKANGTVAADKMLAMLRSFLNDYAANSDDYTSPIVPRMMLTSTKERARSRVLSRIELQAFWAASEKAGLFGSYLRFILLTAVRRNEASHMRRSEITGTDWTIGAHRYKTAIDFLVPMSGAAVAVLDNVPRVGKSDFVFTIDGRHPIGDMGRRKAQFDELMLIELRKLTGDDDVTIPRWTIHDLRRTARTMMSQAKVPAEHAEAALGHVKKGVEGTYDRWQYHPEKKVAFQKLAELVESIVTPIEAKVAA